MSSSQLTVGGRVFVPKKTGKKDEEAFRILGEEFDLRPEIVELLTATFPTLDDMAFGFTDQVHVGKWADQLNLAQKDMWLEKSRLRRAWTQISEFEVAGRELDKVQEETDLDAPLTAAERGNVVETFWEYYHHTFPPLVMPGDKLIDRIYREQWSVKGDQVRKLTLFPLSRVVNQLHSTKSHGKKQRLAAAVYI